MLDFSNLDGVATAAISDTRMAVNPFGIRDSQGRAFEAEIRRAGHEDWEDALNELDTKDPDNKRRRKQTLKVAYGQLTGGVERKGFRKNPKDSQSRALDRLVDEIVETPADREARKARDTRKKELAAEHLFIGGKYLADAAGTVDLADKAKRLELLSYDTNPRTSQPVVASNKYLLDGDGKSLMDEGMAVENPWYGMPLGDALLAWMEAEAEDEQKYFLETMEEARGESDGGPASSTASGLPKTANDVVESSNP